MSDTLSIENLRSQLSSLRDKASQFFSEVAQADDIRRRSSLVRGKTESDESVEYEDFSSGAHSYNVAYRLT
jgi:hypothetical protein